MTNSQPISFAVSIVCYHAPGDQIRSAVASLIASIDSMGVDNCQHVAISIVDNSENQVLTLENFAEFSSFFAAEKFTLSLVQGQGNVGYGAGHNLVIMKSDATFHLVMNADIELHTESLQLGIAYLLDNPDVAAVSPYAKFQNGEKQYLCKRFPSIFDFFLRGFMPQFICNFFSGRLAKFEMHELSEAQASKDIPIISGCFMLCKTEALQKVAGFDDRYFLYFEDFDLSLRLGEIYSLAYLPSMKIVHHGGNSARKGLKHIKHFVTSGMRFFGTYGWRWY